MANPISNDTLTHVGNKGLAKAQERGESGRDIEQGEGQEVAAGRQGVSVSVSRAAEVLNQQASDRPHGGINTPEQASEMAKRISAMFAGNSGQALAAQAKGVSAELGRLLEAR